MRRRLRLASLLAVALAGCTTESAERAVDLVATVEASPQASLAVLDLEADSLVVDIRADTLRPAPALTAFVTARAAASLDPSVWTVRRPRSALASRRLPGLEPQRRDTAAWTLDALLDAALRGDRAAGDEALALVGRGPAEAAAPADVEAPVPLGGLTLAWAPGRRGSTAAPDDLAATFLALPRSAQRDSAFARDRAFLTSRAYRAAETQRLERGGLGLSPARQRAVASATLPQATARGLARLAADLSERLASLRGSPPRTASGRAAGFGAAATLSPDGRRLGVLLWAEPTALSEPADALAEWVGAQDIPDR